MKKLFPALALALLAGCSSLTPDAAFLAAARSYHGTMATAILPLTDSDPTNDPDLSGSNGQALRLAHDAMALQIQRAEEAHQETR